MEDIDLRSDTVTRPGPGMRRAMAEAEVGDDVYGEDPTVRRLEERVAELLGTEAALLVPSGTMANQIALRALVRAGDEVMIGATAHCWMYESGALAALAGAQTQVLPGDGRFTAAAVRAGWKPDEAHLSPTTVVAVENTHNMAGGVLWDMTELRAVQAAARDLGMALHLDGARLWNAEVATGVPLRDLAAGFDTVAICLSKGLGAPLGSLVASTRARIALCRRFRKMYGGGMRQAGVIAAAALVALEHMVERLAEDHRRARRLADVVAERWPDAGVDPERVRTNVVTWRHPSPLELVDWLAGEGVLAGTIAPGVMRVVTHHDVDDEGIERAVRALAAAP
jgi:threonine aldolase